MKNVRGEIDSLVEFLKSHGRNNPVHVDNSRVHVDNVKHDDLKLLVHKFLHQKHLNHYKVHSQSGIIEIIPHDKKDEDSEGKGRSPTAPETMPYFFPGR